MHIASLHSGGFPFLFDAKQEAEVKCALKQSAVHPCCSL